MIGLQKYVVYFYDTIFMFLSDLALPKLLFIDVVVLCVFCDSVLTFMYVLNFE